MTPSVTLLIVLWSITNFLWSVYMIHARVLLLEVADYIKEMCAANEEHSREMVDDLLKLAEEMREYDKRLDEAKERGII